MTYGATSKTLCVTKFEQRGLLTDCKEKYALRKLNWLSVSTLCVIWLRHNEISIVCLLTFMYPSIFGCTNGL